jgi:hypothetical protein
MALAPYVMDTSLPAKLKHPETILP